jgi:hypothetical protein
VTLLSEIPPDIPVIRATGHFIQANKGQASWIAFVTKFSCKSFWYSVLSATLLSTILSGCGQHASTNGGEGTHETITKSWQPGSSGERTRYWVGTLNGIKLRIPEYYLFPKKIVYEGERHDGLGPASEGATQDSQIINFGLLLRVANLQPIRTDQDRQDWFHSQHVWADSSWMMVDFDNIYPIDRNPNPGHYMLPRFGPFDQDANFEYGLVHFESVQPISQGENDSREYGHVEYFFDLKNLTRIECDTIQTKVKPFKIFSTCQHRFFVPELNAMAEAFYAKKDLPRWREIEAHIRNIVHTFIVDPVVSETH